MMFAADRRGGGEGKFAMKTSSAKMRITFSSTSPNSEKPALGSSGSVWAIAEPQCFWPPSNAGGRESNPA
jgi:hypothetical protein